MVQSIWNMGFDAVRWLWRYFLLGAVIVIPIWLIVRFDAARAAEHQPNAWLPFGKRLAC